MRPAVMTQNEHWKSGFSKGPDKIAITRPKPDVPPCYDNGIRRPILNFPYSSDPCYGNAAVKEKVPHGRFSFGGFLRLARK